MGSPTLTVWGRLVKKENIKYKTSFRAPSSCGFFSCTANAPLLQAPRSAPGGAPHTENTHFNLFQERVSLESPRFVISRVWKSHCSEGESEPDASEAFSAESLAFVPKQRLQTGGLWARRGPQMVRCSVLSFCSVFLKNVN